MIYVFKTSVRTKSQVKNLRPHIDQVIPDQQWNFDLQDCDKILRVKAEENIVQTIINLLHQHRFQCEELE